ncbi:MAG: cytochrome b/b6 domain-containing protein [Sulfurovum sp.]|nr:cytochrome b/b6 domain-containing protein [Sulfurovum sp.]
MTKKYIWPVATRLAHVLIIIFFAVAYVLGDFDELLNQHVAFGLALGVVFAFRVIWGFIGPKHSRFRDFNFFLGDLKEYLLNPFSKTKEYEGHNPASSYAIVAMIAVAFLTILTGMLAYGIQENHGVFSFLHNSYYREMEVFEEAHEILANLFLAIVGVHIAGALIDKFIKNGDAIDSMISGYKRATEEVKLNFSQKIFSFVWIAVSLLAIFYLLFTNNVFVASHNVKQDYATLHEEFYNECGSCHMIYPPNLLPKKSWIAMMKDLENHFGDDASIDDSLNHSILAFLIKKSAENSTSQASLNILKSLKDVNKTVIAISKTPYWDEAHKDVDDELFNSEQVLSKANCKVCHIDIEYGIIENNLIKIPKVEK